MHNTALIAMLVTVHSILEQVMMIMKCKVSALHPSLIGLHLCVLPAAYEYEIDECWLGFLTFF